MSGKHDRSLDDEQSAKLLLTGPIVIRGLGRSVKDALRPGRPSRHRAFAADAEEAVEPTPVQAMPASGPTVAESGPSTDLADAPTTQDDAEVDDAFPSAGDLPQTEDPDGPGEDRVDELPDDAAPGDGVAADQVERDERLTPAGSDGEAAEAGAEGEPFEPDATPVPAEAEVQAEVDDAGSGDDGDAPSIDRGDDRAVIDRGPAVEDGLERDPLDGDTSAPDSGSSADGIGEDPSEQDDVDERAAGIEPPGEADVMHDVESATEDERPAAPAVDHGDGAEEVPSEDGPFEPAGSGTAAEHPELGGAPAGQRDEAEPPEPAPTSVDDSADDALVESDGVRQGTEEPVSVASGPEDAEAVAEEGAADEQGPGSDDLDEFEREAAEPDDREPAGIEAVAASEDHARDVEPDAGTEAGQVDADDPADETPDDGSADNGLTSEAAAEDGPGEPADETGEEAAVDEGESPVETGDGVRTVDEAALDAAAAELLAPDAASDDAPAEDAPSQDPVVAEFIGDRGWTTAEELYSRPIAITASSTGETDDDVQAAEHGEDENAQSDVEAGASTEGIGSADDADDRDGSADADVERVGDQESDPFDEAFLVPDDFEQPGGATIADAQEESVVAAPDAATSDDEGAVRLERADEEEWESADELAADAVTEPGPDAAPLADADAAAEGAPTAVAADAHAVAGDDPSASDAFFEQSAEPDAGTRHEFDSETESEAASDSETVSDFETASDPEQGSDLESEQSAGPEQVMAPADREDDGSEPSSSTAALAAPALATAAAPAARAARPASSRPGGSGRPRPVRERFDREAIGIAVLVVLALVCAGLITAVVLKTQRDAAIAASEAADYTPPPLATPTPAATGPTVAVIGDGTTSAAAQGVTTAQKWSALLGSSLDGTVTTDASSGMGYAAKGSSGETFVQAAAKVPSNADVVIVFGGAADSNVQPLSLAKAATDTFSAVQKQAPDAKLIVVGPAIRAGVDDTDLTPVRNTLRSAAAIAKATWIDPIDADWLSSSKQSASSPSALTVADEKTLASKMEAAVKKALR